MGAYLGEHLCGGSIRIGGDAGDFPGAANQGGTIFIGGSTYLPGAEMSKGTITVKGEAKVLPSFQKMEIVQIDGLDYPKVCRRPGRQWQRRALGRGRVILINRDGNMRDQRNYFEVL